MTIIGRSRTASLPPCTAASMSTVRWTASPSWAPPEIGFVWLTMAASWLCRLNDSGGWSLETTAISNTSTSSSASTRRAISPRSFFVEARSSPVRGSMTLMPSPKLLKPTRPGSRQMSFLGSRPQSTTLGGALATASSTTCGGMRTMRDSRSTTQPPSL